jgi:hypothetical protein
MGFKRTTSRRPRTKGFHLIWVLFRFRKRRLWTYVLWLLTYTITLYLQTTDIGMRTYQLFLSAIPIAVVVAQMVYPTFFGWIIIAVPSLLYTGNGIYSLIRDLSAHQQTYDPEKLAPDLISLTACTVVCVGLIISRPKSKHLPPPAHHP